MVSAAIFSLPVPVHYQSRGPLKVGPPTKKRKRSSSHDHGDGKNTEASGEIDTWQPVQNRPALQFSEYSAVLTPEKRSLYRVAGQAFNQALPTKPFPHVRQSELDESPTVQSPSSRLPSSRLASLDPPMYAPSPNQRKLPLHQRHLAAVTALLHRALSEGDFGRAGRALSLILRDTVGGQGLDIRAEGRWGMGAEILLRQGTQADYKINPSTQTPKDSSSLDKFEDSGPTWFTRKGFEDSRKYYERLIVQYPFHKLQPGAVNALDFYPAMFGLWIYVVQEESKRNKGPPGERANSETVHYENSTDTNGRPPSNLASSQRSLVQAREIADRMDRCMTTMPYSDDFELIRLRGMLSLWIADLVDDLLNSPSTPSDEIEADVDPDSAAAAVAAAVPSSRPPERESGEVRHRAFKAEPD